MKRYISVLFFIMSVLSSCLIYTGVYGSGQLVAASYEMGGFYAVKASDGADVNITRGDRFAVSVICDDNLLPYVNLYSDGFYLKIELLPGFSYIDGTFTVNVTMPVIYSVSGDEGAEVQLSGFTLPVEFGVSLSGMSRAVVYITDGHSVNASIEESSYLEVHSVFPVETLRIDCSGASTADLKNALCLDGEISVNDLSSLRVNMGNSLTGQVSGGSVLYFRGGFTPGPILFSGGSGLVYY